MASQVYSGSGNFTYTNNTGQNVRVIINFVRSLNPSPSVAYPYSPVTISWAGVTISSYSGEGTQNIGRNLAVFNIFGTGGSAQVSNAASNVYGAGDESIVSAPTEIMLAPTQTFSITAPILPIGSIITAYNIVVIPEAG